MVDQYVAQRAWNCAGEVQLDICYVLFRGWRANSDGRRTSAKSTHRLPKPLAILNEAIEAEGHYLNLCSLYRAGANGHFKPAMARQQGRPSHIHVNAKADVRIPGSTVEAPAQAQRSLRHQTPFRGWAASCLRRRRGRAKSWRRRWRAARPDFAAYRPFKYARRPKSGDDVLWSRA